MKWKTSAASCLTVNVHNRQKVHELKIAFRITTNCSEIAVSLL